MRNYPWNPGYVLPFSARRENPRGGNVRVTPQAPRGTIPFIKGAPVGYALPAYIKDEVVGLGVKVSYQAPRGTITSTVPDYTNTGSLGSLGAIDSFNRGGLGSLGADSVGASDPVVKFGKAGAKAVLSKMASVPKEHRVATIKAVLDSIDPTLYKTVADKAEIYKSKGKAAKPALESALAAAFANHLLEQVKETGRKGAIPKQGVLGLAAYPEAMGCACDRLSGYMATEGFFGSIADFGKKVGKGIAGGVAMGAKGIAHGVAHGAEWTGGKIGGAAKSIYNAGKSALQELGKLACGAMNSNLFKTAAATAATGVGGPAAGAAAAQGADLLGGACSKLGPKAAVTPDPTPPIDTGLPMLPLLAGAGVLAYILLRK